ncbi:MAG: hypothetical protein KAT75_03535, partial [Dehalococcoidia bacterium]|nr:hypothetical protein [Dehalococcoidia bacterium]
LDIGVIEATAETKLGGFIPGEDGQYLAHAAVIVGKPSIQLGERATHKWALVGEIDLEPRLGEI